jgi:hypothetical protein
VRSIKFDAALGPHHPSMRASLPLKNVALKKNCSISAFNRCGRPLALLKLSQPVMPCRDDNQARIVLAPVLAFLGDIDHAERPAGEDDAGVSAAFMHRQHIERIAVRGKRSGNEAPLEGISDTKCKRTLGDKPAKPRLIGELDAGAAWRLHDHAQDALLVVGFEPA